MKKTILLTAALVAALAAEARFSTTHVELTDATDAVLQGDTIYDVSESRTISANAGESRFRVQGNRTVAINVKKGVTLTIDGGAATGEKGAGAAICVEPGSTLYLLGEGTLVANGGAAGNGLQGGGGGNGYYTGGNTDSGTSGAGGKGGAGGGGGAAAIGGTGGAGGSGGSGGASVTRRCNGSDFSGNGNDGSAGTKGANGTAMGRVVILGNLTVSATAGTAATADGAAGGKGSMGTDAGSGNTRNYASGGGGGGGGGARGQSALFGIGGGGAGGAGGGGGGSGGTQCTAAGSGHEAPYGAGGKGGASAVGTAGATGDGGNPTSTHSRYWGSSTSGGGGTGGEANAARAGDGTLVVGASVRFASFPRRASNTPVTAATDGLYTTRLDFQSQGALVGSAEATLMRPLPACADVTRNGYRFLGYFTAETGGVCVYGPDGTPFSSVWESVENAVTLYARWEVGPTMLVVNTNEDGENLGDGKVTLRDAVRELCANDALAGTNGLRRIEFDLPDADDKNVIALTSALAAKTGTAPFEISGYNGGRGVTVTTENALTFAGSDVRLESLNFKDCAVRPVAQSGGYLTLADCSFVGGQAGAVECGDRATLAAVNCTFADNAGGAVKMGEGSAAAAFANCTFARNKGAAGSAVGSAKASILFIHCTLVPGDADALVRADGVDTYFLNTLVVRPSGGTAVAAGSTNAVCSTLGTKGEGEILNAAQEGVLLGVRHVWYVPVQSTASGNRDAAQIFYDNRYENVAIVTNGVRVAVCGEAGLATMPLAIDQLHAARMAPVRGAIRIATGVQPAVVNVEGVAWGLTNATVDATATVSYDDDTTTERTVKIKTNGDAVFGAAVEVDGSDLSTHNATEVKLSGLVGGDVSMTVATSPYALVASSATALVTEDSAVALPGDEIRIASAIADSLVTTGLSVGGESFSAGSLAGFQDITLDGVNVRGGALRLLGSNSRDGGAEMANLTSKSIGGGEGEESGALASGTTKSWTAKHDGFVQIRGEAKSTSSATQVGLTVGGLTVTPMGALGDGAARTPVWTVPVRKGEVVTLHANGLTLGYKIQFVYFGVKE